MLFNGIKGVHKKFQSRTGELLTNYIQSALDLEDDDEKAMANYILVNVMQLCCEWTTSKDSKDVFDVLLVGYNCLYFDKFKFLEANKIAT